MAGVPEDGVGAHALMAEWFRTRDEGALSRAVAPLEGPDDEQVLAIMTGSDNDMGAFSRAVYLLERRGLVSAAEVSGFVDREVAVRAAGRRR